MKQELNNRYLWGDVLPIVTLLVGSLTLSHSFAAPDPIADLFQFPLAGEWNRSQRFAVFSSTRCGLHTGDDVPRNPDTEVHAVANGIVRFAQVVNGLGHAVVIEHRLTDNTYVTSKYFHLKRPTEGGISLAIGREVRKGELIGFVTGNPKDFGTGSHLHFAIRNSAFIGGRDPRTHRWFYPGYTAIYDAPGDTTPQCNEADPTHTEIIREWCEPSTFIRDGVCAFIDDNFNDNFLNPDLWSILSPPPGFIGTVVETNQRLEVTVLSAGVGGVGIVSNCSLAGDFDVEIDYILLNWPTPNFHNVRLGVFELGVGPGGAIGLNRSSFEREIYLLALPASTAQILTTDTSGTLRLVRTGATLSGFVRDGTAWVPVGSGPVSTIPTRINLDLGAGNPTAPGGIKAAFDNFKVNAGSVQCP